MKFLLAVVLFASSLAVAQQPNKVKLFIDYTGDDRIGTNFVFALREAIANSATYQTTFANDGLRISIVSVDGEGGMGNEYAGNSTALSVVIAANGDSPSCSWLLSQRVLIVGKDRTRDMAASLLASLDKDRTQALASFQHAKDSR